jgi:hypothetical protein
MSTLTLKIESLYAACSPELGVVSYGSCSDEALNNLTDEIRIRQSAEQGTEGKGERGEPQLARAGNSAHRCGPASLTDSLRLLDYNCG